MSKVIIGIHGLQNKPPREILDLWWRKSILDGLWFIDKPRIFINFCMTYWANIPYPAPLDPAEHNPESPFFIHTPYTEYRPPCVIHATPYLNVMRKLIMPKLESIIFNKTKYFNLNALGHYIIRRRFNDLYAYYKKTFVGRDHMERPLKEIVRNELAKVLKKYRKHDILLIAHSMGAIIAYDVLTSVVPDIPVHTLITIGSPLGSPIIQKEIIDEQREVFHRDTELKTPPSITHRWYDLVDPDDNISAHRHLTDEFKPNEHDVQVIVKTAQNDYEYNGIPYHHKIYGYLRTRECAKIIDDFLSEGKIAFWESLKRSVVRTFIKKHKNNQV